MHNASVLRIRHAVLGIAILACAPCVSVIAENPVEPDAENPIYNVNEAKLTCSSPTTVATVVHPQRAEIWRSGVLPLGELGYQVNFNKLPDFREWTAAISLHDSSRGVDDNYVLLSRSGRSPFNAAYVVTRLPGSMSGDEAMGIVLQMQKRNAGVGKTSFVEADTGFGRGIEMVVGGRIGSACFPTSQFQYAPSAEEGSIGISRFVVRGGDLIEYALVLPWSAEEPQQQAVARAQVRMDAFQNGLELSARRDKAK